MKILKLLILLFSLFSCEQASITSHKEKGEGKQLVAENEIYQFVNYLLKDFSLFGPINNIVVDKDLVLDPLLSVQDSITIVKMDSVFSSSDVIFLFQQSKNLKSFRFKSEKLPSKTVISSDTLLAFRKTHKSLTDYWKNFKKEFGSTGYCTISMPLFSVDKSKAIIRTSYHCGGFCGGGGTYIFKKENGKWTLIKTLSNWES